MAASSEIRPLRAPHAVPGKVDPALVEAVDHLHARSRVAHAGGAEYSFPLRAWHGFGFHETA